MSTNFTKKQVKMQKFSFVTNKKIKAKKENEKKNQCYSGSLWVSD